MHTTIDHDIVQMLVDAGATLPHEVRDRIVSRGARAAPTLLALARGEIETKIEIEGELEHSMWPQLHAMEVLGDIKDPATIEPLLELLVAEPSDNMVMGREQLVAALAPMGEQVLEPALRAHADNKYAEPDVAMLLARLGIRDERIFTILLNYLQYDPRGGAELLADYGDPRAVEHLREAFDRYRSGEPLDEAIVLICIQIALQRLGSDTTVEQRRKLREIEEAREQRRALAFALAHQREKQMDKERKLSHKKQRSHGKKRRKQQKASRKKNR